MGKKAIQAKKATTRRIRQLSEQERDDLCKRASYEGSPHHKRNPGNFRLTPPSAPREDKTLCDEAGVFNQEEAKQLFERALRRGLVSEATAADGLPKQVWSIDADGRVFEAMYGGSRAGCYHGYPIRRSDPLFDEVSRAWGPIE